MYLVFLLKLDFENHDTNMQRKEPLQSEILQSGTGNHRLQLIRNLKYRIDKFHWGLNHWDCGEVKQKSETFED